jgi:hypothetical protein
LTATATDDPQTRVPYAALLSARAVAAAAFAWAPAVDLAETLRLAAIGEHLPRSSAMAIAVADVVLRWTVAWYALRARGLDGAAARLAGGAFLLEATHGAMAMQFFAGDCYLCPRLFGAFAVNVIAAPLVVAGYAAVLAILAWRHVAADSAESSEQAVVAGALWVAIPQVASAALGAFGRRSFPTEAAWLLAAGLGAAVPFAAALVARARIELRRDWLNRARGGAFPGWRVADRAVVGAAEGLPRLTPGSEDVLVRVVSAGGPFRGGEAALPVAMFAFGAWSANAPDPTRTGHPGVACGRIALGLAGVFRCMFAVLAALPLVIVASAVVSVPGPLVVASATAADGTQFVVTEVPDGDPNVVLLTVRAPGGGSWHQYFVEYGAPLWKGRIAISPDGTTAVLRDHGMAVARLDRVAMRLLSCFGTTGTVAGPELASPLWPKLSAARSPTSCVP